MRVAVVGLGHVGLTTAACLAHVGHEVRGVDDDSRVLRAVAAGGAPFVEPGLAELVAAGIDSGRLSTTERLSAAVDGVEAVLICIGLSIDPSGRIDLEPFRALIDRVAADLRGYAVLVERSTVPVGTGAALAKRGDTEREPAFDLACNPEFMREGHAVEDVLRPSRIVVGASTERAHRALLRLHRPILDRADCPYVATDVATAELIKLAANAFLATKVSFINAVADVCEAVGADVRTVAGAVGLDPRIGPAHLQAGIGYGGACLPADIAVFRRRAEELGVDLDLLAAVARINDARCEMVLEKVRTSIGDLSGRRVALLGLAFKPGTDDVRASPAVDLARRLLAGGATVTAFDPAVTSCPEQERLGLRIASSAYEAADGAEALVIGTDWPEFGDLDLDRLRAAMAGAVIVDGRNVMDPEKAVRAGFLYVGVGRGAGLDRQGAR